MSPANQILLTAALVVGIIVGVLVIGSKFSADCYDFWPFRGQACVITSK